MPVVLIGAEACAVCCIISVLVLCWSPLMLIWLCFWHDLLIDFPHYERLPKMPFRDEFQTFQENCQVTWSHGVKLFRTWLVVWFSSEFGSGSVQMQIKFTLNENQAHVNSMHAFLYCLCREDMKTISIYLSMYVFTHTHTHFCFLSFQNFTKKHWIKDDILE